MGSLWRPPISLTCCALWLWPNEHPAAFPFVLANSRGDSISVEVVGVTDSFSQLVEFLDDRVSVFHERLLAGSSSGVQMIGGVKPSERQTASIVLRTIARQCLVRSQHHASTRARSQVADDRGFDVGR